MGLQPFRQHQRVLAVRPHAQMQGLQPAQGQEAVEGPLHGADRVLQEGHLLGQFGIAADHRHAADHIGVAIEVFGGRVHHDIGAVFQRALQDRGSEGVVGHHQQAMPFRDRAHRPQVDDLQHRVGRGLDPDHAGIRPDRGLERGRVGQIDETEVQSCTAPAHALEQAEGAAVDIVHADHMAAGVQQLQDRRRRGQPGGEGKTAAAAFQAQRS
jgi:hypothetical protein